MPLTGYTIFYLGSLCYRHAIAWMCVCKCNIKGVPLASACTSITHGRSKQQQQQQQQPITFKPTTETQWEWMRKLCKICAQIFCLFVCYDDILLPLMLFCSVCLRVRTFFLYKYWNSFCLVVKNGREKWNCLAATLALRGVSLRSSHMYPIYFCRNVCRIWLFWWTLYMYGNGIISNSFY